jgi:hypothetical protein
VRIKTLAGIGCLRLSRKTAGEGQLHNLLISWLLSAINTQQLTRGLIMARPRRFTVRLADQEIASIKAFADEKHLIESVAVPHQIRRSPFLSAINTKATNERN